MSTTNDDEFFEQIEQELEQLRQEEEQRVKAIKAWLWSAGYNGYEIMTHNGLIFISNKDKTRRKKLVWLKKYTAVLQRYGVKATVDDDPDEPYICV
jgi:hypothetical protein